MNNLKQPTTGEFILVGRFDIEIESYLETKQHLASTLIKEEDKPALVDALRIWLVKNVGCFNIVGDYHPVVNLSLWFDHDALTEEFDELLLSFRDWLNMIYALDTKKVYNLLRYIRPDTFILFDGDIPADLIPPPIEEPIDHEVQEVIGFIEEFEQRLNEKLSSNFNVEWFIKDTFPKTELPKMLEKYFI